MCEAHRWIVLVFSNELILLFVLPFKALRFMSTKFRKLISEIGLEKYNSYLAFGYTEILPEI